MLFRLAIILLALLATGWRARGMVEADVAGRQWPGLLVIAAIGLSPIFAALAHLISHAGGYR